MFCFCDASIHFPCIMAFSINYYVFFNVNPNSALNGFTEQRR